MQIMLEWIQNNESVFAWLAGFSLFTFVATLILVPVFVVKVPPDYFVNHDRQKRAWSGFSPTGRIVVGVLKSTVGLVLVAVGILMLVLPGQGVLTILVGLILLDVPGTHKLGCWIVRQPPVWRSINWLRRKRGREPLQEDPGACR